MARPFHASPTSRRTHAAGAGARNGIEPGALGRVVNELENDPRFWQNYEIWLFMYNTGNPIAYSALLLRDALVNLVAELDPEGKDSGLKNLVVAGHSQGGLLTKMSVIDSGMQLWPFSIPPEQLDVALKLGSY